MEGFKPRPGDTQFRGEEAIQPHAGRQRNDQLNFQIRPGIASLTQCSFLNINIAKLVDTVSLASQRVDVECLGPYPLLIIGVQGIQGRRNDVADIPALEDWPIPCLGAGRAFIDKPGIKFFTIGIEPDLATGLERLGASATTAHNPGLRGNAGDDGPLDPKNIAHTVLAFRQEVHQDGGRRSPSGARYGDVSEYGGGEKQVLHMAHFINAKPISDHHPMNMLQSQDSAGHPAKSG